MPAVLIASLFLAWALAAAWSMPRAPMALTGILLAASPTVLYYGGVLNPNSLEITAAMGMGASLIAWFGDPESEVAPVLFRRAMIAAAVMALTRMLSPLWLACFALVLLVALGRQIRRWRSAGRGRLARRPVAACVISVAWTVTQIGFVALSAPVADLPFREALRESLLHVDLTNLAHVIAVFGWNDTKISPPEYNYFIIGSTFLVAMTWLFLTVRRSLALVLLMVIVYFLPVVLQAWQWNDNGAVWQGRSPCRCSCSSRSPVSPGRRPARRSTPHTGDGPG